jgi:hypothetical protein
MSITAVVQKQVDRAMGKVAQMFRRAIVKTVNAQGFGQLEAFAGENYDSTEFWQHFGFASRPPAGTEALIVLVDADGEKPIATVTTNRAEKPPALAVGDAALFGTKDGSGLQALVWAKADGDVDITAATSGFVTLGGSAAAGEFAIKGESLETKLDNLNTAVNSITPAGSSAANITDLITALDSFSGSASALLASKGKVF